MAIGRISGPLLKANLQRDRVDLAFETDLIYLQVTDALAANHRVGIKTSSPAYTLDVNGTTRTTNFKTGLAEIDDVTINNNSIASTLGNLVISAATATDKVLINNDTKISANLEVTGDLTFNGNINLGDANFDNITINGEIASHIIPDLNGTYDLGTAAKQWRKIYTDDISVTNLAVGGTIDNSEIYLTGNTIGTVNTDVDLILAPNGLGTVVISSNQALQIPVGNTTVRPTGTTGEIRFNTTTGQFEGFNGIAWSSLGGVRDVDGNTYIIPELSPGSNENTLYFYTNGNLSATLNSTRFDTTRITVDTIAIDGNIIETTSGNANLELRAAGTGYVTFTDTNAIKIPVGTTAQRLSGVTGQVRFNSETTQFEGYNGTAWSSLGGVRDIDGNTYIIPEASTGANDNTLWFYNDGVLSATLTKTALTLNPTTGSTSTTTGALVVSGGAGIAENIYLGSDLVGSGVTTSEIDSFTINGGEY